MPDRISGDLLVNVFYCTEVSLDHEIIEINYSPEVKKALLTAM